MASNLIKTIPFLGWLIPTYHMILQFYVLCSKADHPALTASHHIGLRNDTLSD